MRDVDVRVALRARLADEHLHEADTTLVIDELGLCGQARVDVAVVNGALTGYELKSARDRLDRLPNQVQTYGLVVDRAFLVVAESHLRAARTLLPSWWGIVVATGGEGDVTLRHGRKGRPNPHIDPHSLAQLVWRDEALDILQRHDLDHGVRGKPRHVLWHRLAEHLDLDVLRAEVRDTLRARREWRVSRAPRGSVATSPSAGTTPRFLARRLR